MIMNTLKTLWSSETHGHILPIAVGTILFGLIAINLVSIEFFELFYAFSRAHEDWDLDEWAAVLLAAVVTMSIMSAWRWRAAARRARVNNLKIIETIRSEVELRRALELSKRETKAQLMLLATMSHELRTPLNSILGYSELLHMTASDRLSEKERDHLTTIQGSGRILLGTINKILEMARLESQDTQPDRGPISVRDAVREVVGVLDVQAAGKGLIVTATTAPDHIVTADLAELRSVLFNVIGNAIKYTQFGSITVTSERVDGETRVVVSDTGRGMTDTELVTALSPFGRADAMTDGPEVEGTGLGLTISRRIMDRHGGSLHITSKPSDGTRVTLVFPDQVDVQATAA